MNADELAGEIALALDDAGLLREPLSEATDIIARALRDHLPITRDGVARLMGEPRKTVAGMYQEWRLDVVHARWWDDDQIPRWRAYDPNGELLPDADVGCRTAAELRSYLHKHGVTPMDERGE